MTFSSRKILILLVSLFVFSFPSCNPQINQFTVLPDRTCGNDTSKAVYDVAGTPSLTKETRGSGSPDTITYTLIVERYGKKTFAKHDVLHWISSPEIDMAFESQRLGLDSLIATNSIDSSTFGEGINIGTITSRSIRPIRLTHLGHEIIIDANGTTETFRHVPPGGTWMVQGALLPGEKMGDPSTLRMRIHINLNCSR